MARRVFTLSTRVGNQRNAFAPSPKVHTHFESLFPLITALSCARHGVSKWQWVYENKAP